MNVDQSLDVSDYCSECSDPQHVVIVIVWFAQQILNWKGYVNFHQQESNPDACSFSGIEGQTASQRTNGIHKNTIFYKNKYMCVTDNE